MPASTVFISYSHRNEPWKERLLPQLQALEQAGVAMQVWHDRKIDGGDKWYPEIQDAMANAAAAILLISADFLASRFCVQEEVPALLKRQEEQGMLLIPVLLLPCPWKVHRWLKDRQMLPRDGKCVATDFPGDHANTVFAAVAEQVLVHFEQLASVPATADLVPEPVQTLAAQRPPSTHSGIIPPKPVAMWPTVPAACIDLTRLPETGSALFGRDEELTLLDQAWESLEQANANSVRVLAFTAHGGVGKSTLVNQWLAEMKRDHYRGATRIFGWSFYSQGVRTELAASADVFIAAALRFFGDEAMARSSASPWDKGERLARLVGGQRTLVVLDGMEPLQSASSFERGKLRDPALESLLRSLARHSAGLCLITTREPLPNLEGRPGVVTRDLEQITPQAGRALLRTSRVVGTDAELERLAGRFGPHALAVSLLGVYLREQPGHEIAPAQVLEQLSGDKPIDRVLAGFEQWLGDSPERETLRLLGLFDRPADAGCLRALRTAPAIPGLTEHLAGLEDAQWERVLARLEKLRLIHLPQNKKGESFVDAHPLIREYFAAVLKTEDAWRAAHRRLYEHLCTTETDKKLNPTLEDLQPLYQAVAHGCRAGLHQEACEKVYRDRILRGTGHDGFYTMAKLGAMGSDLGAVACFFEQPWSRISSALNEPDQAFLLNEVASRLRGLVRLTDALEPMRTWLNNYVEQERWEYAARLASNLSESELTLGEVTKAVEDAARSVTYADRSDDASLRMPLRTTHADALYQAGRRDEAETRFRESEQMQQKMQPEYHLLYSVQGFQFCDLLLAAAERAAWQTWHAERATPNAKLIEVCRAVSQRAVQTLKITRDNWLLEIALDHLTLGRAVLYEAILANAEGGAGNVQLEKAKIELDDAVSGLRRAGTQNELPRGLLTRAWLRYLTGTRTGPASAQDDLDEAWEIAERGPMRLFMADILLTRARLFGHAVNSPVTPALSPQGRASEAYPWESPAADLAAAEKLINSCGYHRRDEELADAKAAILSGDRHA